MKGARCVRQGICLLLGLIPLATVCAGELNILSSNAVSACLTEATPQLEKVTGASLRVRYDTANALKAEVDGGAVFDLVILTTAADQALADLGHVIADSITPITRIGIGVVVRAGQAKPDISTPDAFKAALLHSKSIVYTANGASGQYVEGLIKRLGLTETLAAKTLRPQGGAVAELVARGEAELGIQQISELLPVAGVDFVGPLPDALQHYSEFSAAIGTHAAHPEDAKKLIGQLLSPAVQNRLPAHGMQAL